MENSTLFQIFYNLNLNLTFLYPIQDEKLSIIRKCLGSSEIYSYSDSHSFLSSAITVTYCFEDWVGRFIDATIRLWTLTFISLCKIRTISLKLFDAKKFRSNPHLKGIGDAHKHLQSEFEWNATKKTISITNYEKWEVIENQTKKDCFITSGEEENRHTVDGNYSERLIGCRKVILAEIEM